MNGLDLDKKISTIQIAVFFAPGTTFRALEVANSITNRLGDIFNADPNILPIPNDAPVEIPRVIFQRDNDAQFSIGYSRADLILNMPGNYYDFESVSPIIKKIEESLMKELKLNIVRIGLVLTYSIVQNLTINDFSNNYIQDINLEDSTEFNLSWLVVKEKGILKVNKWTRIFLNKLTNDGNSVIMDINTNPDIMLDYSKLSLGDVIKELFLISKED